MLFKAAIVGAFAGLVVASPLEQRAVNPSVSISSGWLVGTATSVRNQATVTGLATAYLAVPFAASPTRFAPPVAPTSWATKTVQTLGSACLQQFAPGPTGAKVRKYFENPFGPYPLKESEDCLHLNVYVPPNTNANSLKTVMVWFYGGNLASGSNAVDAYNGSSLAVNNDVIVVVPNYRTNVFGFSSSPAIPLNQQNSGFLDQRFALQWVQKNIKSFGGDASKVTIFGESAGGYSVKQLLAQPPSPRPFRAAIMESSGYNAGNGPDGWNKLVAKFCSSKPSGQSDLECLRKASATDIQTYAANPDNKVGFSPVLDNTYTASSTLDELQSGKFADVPLLIGSNLNEATIFANILGINQNTNVADGVKAITGIDLGSAGDQAGTLYPGLSGFDLISRIATDLAFTCTSSLFSSAVATNITSPVWRYRYDGDFPNTRYFQGAGAYHSSEITEVFGTYPLKTEYANAATADQINLSKYMQNAWTTFAKNPSTGPQPGQWDEFVKPFTTRKIGVLGGVNNTAGLNQQIALWTDAVCVVYGPVLLAANYAF